MALGFVLASMIKLARNGSLDDNIPVWSLRKVNVLVEFRDLEIGQERSPVVSKYSTRKL